MEPRRLPLAAKTARLVVGARGRIDRLVGRIRVGVTVVDVTFSVDAFTATEHRRAACLSGGSWVETLDRRDRPHQGSGAPNYGTPTNEVAPAYAKPAVKVLIVAFTHAANSLQGRIRHG